MLVAGPVGADGPPGRVSAALAQPSIISRVKVVGSVSFSVLIFGVRVIVYLVVWGDRWGVCA